MHFTVYSCGVEKIDNSISFMTRIIELEGRYKLKWDNYVRQSPEGTFFHLTGWKDVIEKTFLLKSIYLMAVDESDEIRGILPLFLMKDILRRKYLVSIPFSAYAGVCADDKETEIRLFDNAKDLAITNGVQYLELRQRSNEMFQLQVKKDFVSMFLRLNKDEAILWKESLDSKARNQVRKAYKEGLKVDLGKQYLDDFYEILSVNIRDLGSPNYPKIFLKNILQAFDKTSNIMVVSYRDTIIGGMFFIGYKNIFYDPWAASSRKYVKLCPNDILYWEAIKYACMNDYDYFDLGRSTADSGTFHFKKKWGAETVQLNYQYFLNRTHRIPMVSAHDNKYQLAIDLWKKLPLVIAKPLGARLIRYLPEL